jgi:hypothetical protein
VDLYVKVQRGGKSGLQRLPEPPHGKGYMVVPVPNELIDKVNKLDHNGHWERELSELLEATIQRFFQTRAISISTPSTLVKSGAGLSLYDPRDPLKGRG